MDQLSFKTEKRKVRDLVPWEFNPRVSSENQQEKLKALLLKFGLTELPVVDVDNTVVAGHQRLAAMKALGWEEKDIEVRVPNRKLTPEEFQEYNVASNKTGELAKWDWNLLANIDEGILLTAGFEKIELSKGFDLLTRTEEDEFDAEKEAEAITEPKSKLGEVYQLGNHRLMCGDSTKREDVEKLMKGEKADMVFTDPPYNVDYGSSKNPRHKIRNLVSDNQTPEEWEWFCQKFIENICDFYKGGDVYIWGASGPEGIKQRLWLVENGFHWSATIVWKKQQLVLSPANYQRMYEPCFYGWLTKSTFSGDRKQTEVWEIDRPLNSKLHPTMKPIELCAKGIQNSSKRDDIVLDLFGGSGSTMIAAEQLGRKCYICEIDPIYCDVIRKRWERFTTNK